MKFLYDFFYDNCDLNFYYNLNNNNINKSPKFSIIEYLIQRRINSRLSKIFNIQQQSHIVLHIKLHISKLVPKKRNADHWYSVSQSFEWTHQSTVGYEHFGIFVSWSKKVINHNHILHQNNQSTTMHQLLLQENYNKLPKTATWGIHEEILTLSGNPGSSFSLLPIFMSTLIGCSFLNIE